MIKISRLKLLSLLLASTCSAFSMQSSAASGVIVAEPIPPGFQFPSPREEVQRWSDERDIRAARTHAWYLWEGMNQPSSVKDSNGKILPVWETWYSNAELFPPKPSTQSTSLAGVDSRRTSISRPVQIPSQFHTTSNPDQVLSFNKFNPAAAEFITEPHQHDGKTYYYNSLSSLTALNNAFNANNTPVKDRQITDFPNRAIETKPVFMLVKKSGLTAIPYWQGPQTSVTPTQPTPNTWTTCVLFDPGSTASIQPATSTQITQAHKSASPNCKSFLYAGLSQIYSYQLETDAQLSAFKDNQGGSPKKGDHAVLMAMHINTKEIVNWTWQTFFWSGGETPPNAFPGSMSRQPASLEAPWNNYAMCTAYWQENLDGSIHTCFNPYLETAVSGIPDGLNSNCVSCHGTARTHPYNNAESPVPKYPKNYVRENEVGPAKFSPTYFKGNTRTDFSWAIPLDSQ
ncbi:MAG: hypothetical protein ACR2PT_21475 [Endozoicomonas sp.]